MKLHLALLFTAAMTLPALAADQTQSFSTKAGPVQIMLNYGGKNCYFAGDTEGVPGMRALKNIDVAFIPMNLPYTMTPQEAADAVKAFHPKVAIPYHYKGQDIEAFKKALDGSGIDVRLLDRCPQEQQQ